MAQLWVWNWKESNRIPFFSALPYQEAFTGCRESKSEIRNKSKKAKSESSKGRARAGFDIADSDF
jgi:hypothetical protein